MLRWILTTMLTGAMLAAVFAAVQQYEVKVFRQKRVQALESRLGDLKGWYGQHLDQNRRLAEWRSLWQDIQRKGLREKQWDRSPITIVTSLTRGEQEKLLLLLANDRKRGGNFWYVPRKLSIQGEKQDQASDLTFQVRFSGVLVKPDPYAPEPGRNTGNGKQ
ncbi:MAG: hypothetical protein K9J48_02030 [Desulfohalobiaceae bacterium]|nr:hypothetical protein [Desulfohalobiaceae bacterium]MCF8085649.1 hypothetical protein [Desulfohalobiaceae bacterium]